VFYKRKEKEGKVEIKIHIKATDFKTADSET